MKDTEFHERIYIRKGIRSTEFGLLIAILITLILKLRLIFLLNIDIDEFTFLSFVHQHLQGTLSSQFFRFHVHFFSWLPGISGNEVAQIFAARMVMYLLSLGACIFLYLIGRLFFNRSGALFSVLCYLSISNVIVHGASFRFDPMCGFLFLCSVYFLLRTPRSSFGIIIAGFNTALSLMISLKTILYFPTIGVIFIFQYFFEKSKRKVHKEIVLFSITLIIGFVLLHHFHLATLAKGVSSVDKIAKNLASQGILFKEFFPNRFYMIAILVENLFIWLFWLGGLIFLVWDLIYHKSKLLSKNLLLLSLFIPLLSLAFYKYSFPYFYVFILSPAIIFSGVLIDKVTDNFKKKGYIVSLILIYIGSLTIIGNFFFHYKRNAFDQTIAQREMVQLVHKIFPETVPYIDRCFMISSFPMVGLQMTSWDMARYTTANRPIMQQILIKHKPKLIVANIVHLDLSVPRGSRMDIFKNYPLLEEDYNILKDNFIHHWGVLYVAGKHLRFNSTKKYQTFEMLIPGTYTLESEGEVFINGVIYEPGSKINLEQMVYTIVPKTSPMEMTLRWGKDLYKPHRKPSTQPIFLGYYLQALKMRN